MKTFGIKKIQYCKANNVAFSGICYPELGIASTLSNTLTDICFAQKQATLSIEESIENKNRIYTSKLVFVTDEYQNFVLGNYVFVATATNGDIFIIGLKQRPYVLITTVQNLASNGNDINGYTITCTWKSVYRPLLVTAQPNTEDNRTLSLKNGAVNYKEDETDNRNLAIKNGAVNYGTQEQDNRQLNICCGEIVQEQENDNRQFDICCGQIIGQEEIQPQLLTVIWLNGNGSELDRKTYYEGEQEPTTNKTPTKTSVDFYWSFKMWNIQSNENNIKTYQPEFEPTYAKVLITSTEKSCFYSYQVVNNETRYSFETDAKKDYSLPLTLNKSELPDLQIWFKKYGTITNVDLTNLESFIQTDKIYQQGTNNVIGYSKKTWPENNVVIIYAWSTGDEGETDETEKFDSWATILNKGTQIPDISQLNNGIRTHITRTGYHCVGWSLTPGGTTITLGQATNHIVLHAIWEPNN